jgi:IclR family acetate operon transcriptional repressor
VYLEKKGHGQVLTVATRIGGRNPAHASAMGKALLAGLPEKELRRLLGRGPLPALTEHTISEVPALLEELERIRRQGFALDDEETFPGIRCVAAPIRNARGATLAAISVTVPRSRLDSRRRQDLRELVVAAARSVSERCREEAVEGER